MFTFHPRLHPSCNNLRRGIYVPVPLECSAVKQTVRVLNCTIVKRAVLLQDLDL